MNISDIMIHINESLDQEERTLLENSMREIEGVISPRFNEGKEHLLLIAFDPAKASTKALIERTREAGYTAQLVGA